MIVSILQSNYIPWKGYFDMIAKSDIFIVYDDVQYTKNDWRNRNLIKAPNGLQWITIPVKQESLDQKIFETKIAFRNWSQKHMATLQNNYAKATFFKDYKDRIFDLYNDDSDLLTDINQRFIKGVCKMLDIKTAIIDSRSLRLKGNRIERLIDACKLLNAKTYLSGPAAKNYIDVSLFEEAGIKVEWMDYAGYAEYNQLYPPFHHNVSIIDLIFNTGPDARKYLNN